MNKVILIGNLGKAPEFKNSVCKFSIATTESYKTKDGEKKKDTTWHNVVSFGKLAEICNKYLVRGSKVMIEGSIQNGSYEKEGVKKYTHDIILRNMEMLGRKEDNASTVNDSLQTEQTDSDGLPF